MEIKNIEIAYLNECTSIQKDIVDTYWKIDNSLEFQQKPLQVKNQFNLEQSELTKIIQTYSILTYDIVCSTCDKLSGNKATSQSDFKQSIGRYKHRYFSYKCNACEEEEIKALALKKKEEQKALVQKYEDAINEHRWMDLSPFLSELLHNCLSTDFKALKKEYWSKLGQSNFKKLFRGLYDLAALNLIFLVRNDWSDRIEDYQYLPRLKEEFKYFSPTAPAMESTQVNDTNKLQFRLTSNPISNPISNHPDSPEYAGGVTFKNKIVLEANTEYTFALWKRTGRDLYLTMISTADIAPTPKQVSLSNHPISLQEGIQDFFESIAPQE
ncbi:hypothetical protein [Formosa algae]|uniref:Uncharacterized protein n=1 Tax=Formosa algae TaxID=225843 RepID=A0A9X0YK37_9FLAO|nr:hypothetical protein [Formosa algae]MBP1838634.1 hypothetical protein [Formosa algae]MDQ0335134.1 hypothetical protein [Formosa algae]